MVSSKSRVIVLVLALVFLASCAGSRSIGGGLWGSLGGQNGVSTLVHGFAEKLSGNAAVASALGKSGIESTKMGLYNSVAATGGYTIDKGSDLLGSLKGKNLEPEVVKGIGTSLTDAGKAQGLGMEQLAGLTNLWKPVEKALLAGK